MASSMVDDLFDRVLPKHRVVNPTSLREAENLATYYTQEATQGPMRIGREASVWLVTHRVLGTCITCLGAVGQRFQLETEVLNSRVNVQMDSVVRDTQGCMVLAVEDKNCTFTYEQHGIWISVHIFQVDGLHGQRGPPLGCTTLWDISADRTDRV
ncbi:hypothetical protein BC827DRAFT_567251 [Russula dissimulans]|nr:hypothetical protein BC827DRAFT_567251 [Russula dissimulans]